CAARWQRWGLGQFVGVPGATRRLNVPDRQYRLFPGERRFVGFSHFRGGPLTPMTDSTAPVANVVRNERVCAERLGYRFIRKARLRDSLVAGRAPVDNVHSGQPDLIDVGTVIGQQFLCVGTALRKSQIGALVLLPLTAKVLEWRDREDGQENDTRNRKDQARAVR